MRHGLWQIRRRSGLGWVHLAIACAVGAAIGTVLDPQRLGSTAVLVLAPMLGAMAYRILLARAVLRDLVRAGHGRWRLRLDEAGADLERDGITLHLPWTALAGWSEDQARLYLHRGATDLITLPLAQLPPSAAELIRSRTPAFAG